MPWRARFLGPAKHGLAEVVVLAVIYRAYGRLREAAEGGVDAATDNAAEMIAVERAVGLFREADLQRVFLDDPGFLRFWNVYYGVAHFAAPVITLLALWFLDRRRYWYARNALGFMLVAALIGFVAYPLLPPRFLPESYGFVDTAAAFGPAMFSEDPSDAANLYAAMPSLHVGWSLWAAWALWPMVRPSWSRPVLLLYPAATLFAVMITGNHYWIDGAGGALALAVAIAAAWGVRRRADRWRAWTAGTNPNGGNTDAAGDHR